jgi:hypothetical protein
MNDTNVIVKMGYMPLKRNLKFDGGFGIKSGSLGPFVDSSNEGSVSYLFEWDAYPATPSPVPKRAYQK